MKQIANRLLPVLGIAVAAACSGDKIETTTAESSGISVDCTALNADIAVLQTLSGEAVAGSTVLSLEDNVITFSSGETAAVNVRSAYDFNYANPTIGVGSSNWLIDGTDIGAAFADELLRIKGSSNYWYAYYGGEWVKMNRILEGESIPVFTAMGSDDDKVYVALSDGLTISFDKYTGGETLTVDPASAAIEKEGGRATTVVSSNAEWTASAADSWLSVSPSSGSGDNVNVIFTASANDSYSRSTTVTFTTGNISRKVTVSQEGEIGGGVLESADTEDSEDNVSNTTFDRTISVVFSTSGSATVSGATSDFGVTVSGNDVTISNNGSDKVIYALSGTTKDGFLKLYGDKKQALVLNGVSITNKNGAAINNQGKKRCFVIVNGTNTLADGSSYTDTPSSEDEKAALFSEGQLIFSGSGSLTVTATGKAGITSDDYVRVMSSPTIKISSSAGHALRGKDYIKISNGTITASTSAAGKKGFSSDSLVRFEGGVTDITVSGAILKETSGSTTTYSGSAGIKADYQFEMTGGTVTVKNTAQGGKGIKIGGSSDDDPLVYIPASTISGGNLTVTTTGSSNSSYDVSAKAFKIGWAIKSGNKYTKQTGDLVVSGGTVNISCSGDEALEVKGSLTVNGGDLYAYSAADDAINCCGTFTVNDGVVGGVSPANDGLDSNGNFVINGGIIYAFGKTSPELAIDANTEGGFKLYVKGGVLFTAGGLESGASLSQSCYQASSWSKGTWYGMTVGSTSYAFKTPSSGGTPLVVSGSSQPTLKSGVTVSGGTSCLGGMAVKGCSFSGGSSVSLSSYSGGNGGGNMGPGGGGGFHH